MLTCKYLCTTERYLKQQPSGPHLVDSNVWFRYASHTNGAWTKSSPRETDAGVRDAHYADRLTTLDVA